MDDNVKVVPIPRVTVQWLELGQIVIIRDFSGRLLGSGECIGKIPLEKENPAHNQFYDICLLNKYGTASTWIRKQVWYTLCEIVKENRAE